MRWQPSKPVVVCIALSSEAKYTAPSFDQPMYSGLTPIGSRPAT